MTPKKIRAGLKTRVIGRSIECHAKAASTNDLAWAAAVAGAPEGAAFFAEEQTGGRGRCGHTWHSPRGGLWMSVVLRPRVPLDRLLLVTAVGALGVADAVDELGGLASRIRFPNDIVVDDRKISGTLVEVRLIGPAPDLAVMGVGLNVNLERADFPKDLRPISTSLRIETGRAIDLHAAARAVLTALDRWYARLGDVDRVRDEYRRRSSILRRRIRLLFGGETIVGTATAVDAVDGLVVRLDSGHPRALRAEHISEVRLVP